MFDLTDKVAVVTGASSGLGADSARAYAQNGANVVLLARRKEKLEQVAAEISEMGRKVLVISCDVTDEECVKKAVEEIIEKFGRIDILLNNAGVAVRGGVDTHGCQCQGDVYYEQICRPAYERTKLRKNR